MVADAWGTGASARGRGDAVSVVEAAYDLGLDTRAWLAQLLACAAPTLDRGLGVGATMWLRGHGHLESTMVTRGMRDDVLRAIETAGRRAREEADRQTYYPGALATASQRLGMSERETATCETYVKYLHPAGVRDCLNFGVPDPSGMILLITAPSPDTSRPSRAVASRWARIAAHVAAGARLRAAHATRAPPAGDVSDCAEAVLTPSGSIVHAGPAAQGPLAREALRRSARDVDRARSTARGDDDRALELWQGLVAGRWSLVDRFDSDGRRFLVARRNDPDVPDPRALTRRERQVLAYATMGQPLKVIAYALGLSVSTIAIHRTRAMRKLGLTSMAEVTRLFAHERAKETVA